MDNFPPNTQRGRAPQEPKEKIEPVTSATTAKRKRNLGQRFKETFIGGDARSAMDHVVFGVMVPSVKEMLFDAFESGMRTLIFGDSKARRGGGGGQGYSGLGHVAYNRMSGASPRPGPQAAPPRSMSRGARARHDFDDLLIPSHGEANEVLDRMFDLLSRYGSASVADLYELTGVQSNHTDMKWGWYELRGAKAIRTKRGYLLDLPSPEPLD